MSGVTAEMCGDVGRLGIHSPTHPALLAALDVVRLRAVRPPASPAPPSAPVPPPSTPLALLVISPSGHCFACHGTAKGDVNHGGSSRTPPLPQHEPHSAQAASPPPSIPQPISPSQPVSPETPQGPGLSAPRALRSPPPRWARAEARLFSQTRAPLRQTTWRSLL
jgi:hypothetical protein